MTHADKILWMHRWAAKNKAQLTLEGECGICRECVGIIIEGSYPDYEWYSEDHDESYEYKRLDKNGKVWTPEDAYHKHPCVAVLGRGEPAEAQLYEWLKWFDKHGFVLEVVDIKLNHQLNPIELMMGRDKHRRMIKKGKS